MGDVFKTAFQIEQKARNEAIAREYESLMKQEGSMSTMVEKYIMDKYKIHSRTTLWKIRKKYSLNNN